MPDFCFVFSTTVRDTTLSVTASHQHQSLILLGPGWDAEEGKAWEPEHPAATLGPSLPTVLGMSLQPQKGLLHMGVTLIHVQKRLAVKAAVGPAQDSETNSRKTSSVSLKAPTTQLGPLLFWFQVCLLFSESVFMWGKSTNKNKNEFLWEYLTTSLFLSGVYISGLFIFKKCEWLIIFKRERSLLFKT